MGGIILSCADSGCGRTKNAEQNGRMRRIFQLVSFLSMFSIPQRRIEEFCTFDCDKTTHGEDGYFLYQVQIGKIASWLRCAVEVVYKVID